MSRGAAGADCGACAAWIGCGRGGCAASLTRLGVIAEDAGLLRV